MNRLIQNGFNEQYRIIDVNNNQIRIEDIPDNLVGLATIPILSTLFHTFLWIWQNCSKIPQPRTSRLASLRLTTF